MTPRLWQHQPGEAPADFTAFISYLRLQGRRSHRLVAAQTGRSLGAIRRLSANFNWPGRVAAFEARLADASQDALDLLVRSKSTRTTADFERLRMDEFQLFQRVLYESRRWLRLASDPHRREISLSQVCRLYELAFKLGRLAVGMPTGDEPRRRPRKEDAPGYWTGPSAEEALQKIYGSPTATPPSAPVSGEAGAPDSGSSVSHAPGTPRADSDPAGDTPATNGKPPCPVPGEPPVATNDARRDAWASWSRIQRRAGKPTAPSRS
jgi:hypothetical protein